MGPNLALYLGNVLAPILTAIGAPRLRELTADDVRQALTAMPARSSTAAVAMSRLPGVWHSDSLTNGIRIRALTRP
jgi:hypothetical protein